MARIRVIKTTMKDRDSDFEMLDDSYDANTVEAGLNDGTLRVTERAKGGDKTCIVVQATQHLIAEQSRGFQDAGERLGPWQVTAQ